MGQDFGQKSKDKVETQDRQGEVHDLGFELGTSHLIDPVTRGKIGFGWHGEMVKIWEPRGRVGF